MKAYKGFNKDLTCRDFQFEVGKTYIHEGKVEPCESGFHACPNPLDVLTYYPAYNGARYFEVECDGEIKNHDKGLKIACSQITVKSELNLINFIIIGVQMIFDRVKKNKPEKYTSGVWSTAATSGYHSTATTSGNQSTAATSGYHSTAVTSGNWSTAVTSDAVSTAVTSGYQSTSATSGDRSIAVTSGNWSTSATSGDWSIAATLGELSTAVTSGYQSTAVCGGWQSIAVANGYQATAMGALGCYLVLSEYDNNLKLIEVKCTKVDGEKIKPNTLYMLKNGEFVEV